MTADPPADDPADTDATATGSSDTAADATSDTETQSGEPEPDSEPDDLTEKLERLRPPQPQEDLDEPVPPTKTLRPTTAREERTGSDDAGSAASDETAGAHHDTPSAGVHAADRPDDRAQSAENAGLNEPHPVTTELRPVAEQTASDARRRAQETANAADADGADRTRGSDQGETDAGEDTEEV